MSPVLTVWLFGVVLGTASPGGTGTEKPSAVLVDPYFPSVFVAFAGFGKATPQSDLRLAESGEPKVEFSTQPAAGDFIWLRITNNTRWPISVETDSMYLSGVKCGMQISIRFTAYDSKGNVIPSLYDVFSVSELPSDCEVFFPVPRAALKGQGTIRIGLNYGWEPKSQLGMGAVVHEVIVGQSILPPAYQE